MNNLEYARAYVLIQPYMGVVLPEEALKRGTVFPFLLKSYLPQLEKIEKGED
ncbi:spore coat associated protein CotJA [Oxobacter pfennigii]|nr:spore coat associated protein CotJA [Oxobacter pfennigii]